MAKKIVYGDHAKEKFGILKGHGFVISRRQVRETLQKPEKVEEGYKNRKVAQQGISERHVLRVIYEEGPEEIRVVTFYPGRRSQYEG